MVDVRAKTLPRCVDEESEPRPHVALRRFQRGLGCHLGQPSAFRSLVSVRKKYAYQQPRTVGYPESSSVCRRIGKRENRGNFLRQHLSSVLYSVEGGGEVSGSLSSSEGNSVVDRRAGDHSSPSIHPGFEKCSSGLSEKRKTR